MRSINFDDGFRTYAINGDESRVIRVNVTDLNALERFNTAVEEIDRLIADSKGEDATPEKLVELDRIIREQFDLIFGEGMCETVFGRVNILSAVTDGRMLIESFLDAFLPVIREDIAAAAKASNERVNKYIEPVVNE